MGIISNEPPAANCFDANGRHWTMGTWQWAKRQQQQHLRSAAGRAIVAVGGHHATVSAPWACLDIDNRQCKHPLGSGLIQWRHSRGRRDPPPSPENCVVSCRRLSTLDDRQAITFAVTAPCVKTVSGGENGTGGLLKKSPCVPQGRMNAWLTWDPAGGRWGQGQMGSERH